MYIDKDRIFHVALDGFAGNDEVWMAKTLGDLISQGDAFGFGRQDDVTVPYLFCQQGCGSLYETGIGDADKAGIGGVFRDVDKRKSPCQTCQIQSISFHIGPHVNSISLPRGRER